MNPLFQRKKRQKANRLEHIFGHLLTPLENFAADSTSSGLLLLFLLALVLIWANSPWAAHYQHLLHLPLSIGIGSASVSLSLHHWVNDGLMTLFFYLVGLEIKREVMVGELSSLKQAILPIMAALGGMMVPALVFLIFNFGGVGMHGWGIPMATDIAFAMAVLLLLGKRVPAALMTILVALAIVDDLGAVIVIALFYTEALQGWALGCAFLCFIVLLAFNRGGIRAAAPYVVVAVAMWFFMLHSGIHATLAGVLSALATPVKSLYSPEEFSRESRKLLDKFDIHRGSKSDFMSSERLNSLLHTLAEGINKTQPPLQRLEHALHLPIHFFVIPVFVIFNAGVTIDGSNLSAFWQADVAWGVMAGLLLGKFSGVLLATFLCVQLGWAALPEGVGFRHMIGVALLAGIGFTMSIFIAELAFAKEALLLLEAKLAVLLASVVAGVLGYAWLYFLGEEHHA